MTHTTVIELMSAPPYADVKTHPSLARATSALHDYLNGGSLSERLLSDIVVAGTLALSRTDADTTVSGVRQVRDDFQAMLTETRREWSEEKATLQREVEQTKAELERSAKETAESTRIHAQQAAQATNAFVDDVRNGVESLTRALPTNLNQQLEPYLERFRTDLTAAASQVMDPRNGGPGAALADMVRKDLADQRDHIGTRFHELSEKIGIAEARAEERVYSSRKGKDFEEILEEVLCDFSEREQLILHATGEEVGHVTGCKKGDFVIYSDKIPLVVIEAKHKLKSDSDAAKHAYLEEAERNRGCQISIWLVSGIDQNKGQLVRQLNKRRFVVAYDESHLDVLFVALRYAVKYAEMDATVSNVGNVSGIENVLEKASACIKDLSRVTSSAKNIIKSAEGIQDTARTVQRTVTELLDEASVILKDVSD